MFPPPQLWVLLWLQAPLALLALPELLELPVVLTDLPVAPTTSIVCSLTLSLPWLTSSSSRLVLWSACFTSTTMAGLSASAWTVLSKVSCLGPVFLSTLSSLVPDLLVKDLLRHTCVALPSVRRWGLEASPRPVPCRLLMAVARLTRLPFHLPVAACPLVLDR